MLYNKISQIRIFLVSLIITIIFFILTQFFSSHSSSVTLTISAGASLQLVMEEIKLIYEKKNQNVSLIYNFGASGLLQQQIERGAPVDIFFSASLWEMDKLQSENLIINHTRRNLLQNQIVLITSQNNLYINNFFDLNKDKISKFIIGDPNIVPAGRYAKQVLNYYQIWDEIANKLVFGKDVQAVLTYVDLGYVEAGLVYKTSTFTNKKVKIVAIAPPESHQPIHYPIAIIKDSSNIQYAENFIQFLTTKQVRNIFTKYNFSFNK